MGLTNLDYADYELLQTIDREAKGTTADLAETLDREIREVASRMSWMHRQGLCERTIAKNWVLTKIGKEMLNGRSGDILSLRRVAERSRRSSATIWVLRREARRSLG